MTESIHSVIRKEYGKDCLKLTKDFEKTSRKVANYRNHLRFSLRCLHADVIPRSARLQSTIKGSRVEKILHNTERKLLNERIRQINYTINKLNTKKEEISGELETQLPLETYKRVQEFTAHAQLSQHEKTKTRQVAKFGRLASSGRADKDTNWRCKEDKSAHNIRDRWVKNLSDRPLSSNEQSLLEKGLNFAVTSKRVQVTDIITATESAIRNARLGPANAEELRSRVSASVISAKPPQHNLSKAEFTALESLKKNKDITILPADKGRCTVVLNSTDYDKKAKELLGIQRLIPPQ
ncbi:uncharacterized protein [Amphiura filiformis]|uniref:uncharacterized protein n=1 Tax=Amphiura filiformis TaxID=82378 RepID=UPI003B2174B4